MGPVLLSSRIGVLETYQLSACRAVPTRDLLGGWRDGGWGLSEPYSRSEAASLEALWEAS